MATRKKSTHDTRGKGGKSPSWLGLVLILSLGALGVSLYLLHLERKKNADQATLTEKAMKMVEAHPDAEVFQVEDERGSAPAQKKK